MIDVIEPLGTVTFTVTAVPPRAAQVKTLLRLMQMQPQIQVALKKRARQRRQRDNRPIRRGGRIWIGRAHPTKLVAVEPGRTFTLTVTPQVLPDLRSVGAYLEARNEGRPPR